MDNALYIGVDLGRSTRIALVDTAGNIIKQNRVPTELINGRALVDGLIGLVKEMRSNAPLPIAAIGLAVSGLVDYQSQQVKVLPNLPDVSKINIHHELVQAVSLPVIIDNDANAATYGEWRCGAALNLSNIIYIYLGTGIGGGLVLNGQLQHGARGFAGEFG
ncbi:MAG: glucokinase, partial [bacterium]